MELKELVAEFQRLRSFGETYEVWVMDVVPRTGKDDLPLIFKVDSKAVGFPTINNSDFVIMMHPMTWLDIQDSLMAAVTPQPGQGIDIKMFMGIRIPVYDDDARRAYFANNRHRYVPTMPNVIDFREAYRNMR